MKVLMVDVGGTNVKLMNEPGGEMRKFPSGKKLTPNAMIDRIREETEDWDYEVVSLGFPGILRQGKPHRDPLNLGPGWVGFDYEKAFGRPVRMINDASMQALGAYKGGRLLFLGFGTSIGSSIVADDIVVPIEIGLIKMTRKHTLVDRLSDRALEEDGVDAWLESLHETVELLQDVFFPDDTVLGGGNSKLIERLPDQCRPIERGAIYIGALRLWEDADLFASPRESTWSIVRSSV